MSDQCHMRRRIHVIVKYTRALTFENLWQVKTEYIHGKSTRV